MSHIRKLEIRGIRSYSPNRSVCMDFAKPVTLIVGEYSINENSNSTLNNNVPYHNRFG